MCERQGIVAVLEVAGQGETEKDEEWDDEHLGVGGLGEAGFAEEDKHDDAEKCEAVVTEADGEDEAAAAVRVVAKEGPDSGGQGGG